MGVRKGTIKKIKELDNNKTEQSKPTGVIIRGRNFYRQPLSAKNFFEYESRKTEQSPSIATDWLLYQAYKVDGHNVDIEDISTYTERGKLFMALVNVAVKANDDLPLENTGDFTVKGRRFVEALPSSDHFEPFIFNVFKSPALAQKATKEAIERIFLLNGKPIFEQRLDYSNPEDFPFECFAILSQWINTVFRLPEDYLSINGVPLNRNPLSGIQYLDYKTQKQDFRTLKPANDWLLNQAYSFKGDNLDPKDVKRFRDRGRLLLSLTAIEPTCHDGFEFAESADFSLGDFRFKEKPETVEFLDEFILNHGQKIKTKEAYMEAIQKIFSVNGRTIEESDLTDPDGFGFAVTSLLADRLESFLGASLTQLD